MLQLSRKVLVLVALVLVVQGTAGTALADHQGGATPVIILTDVTTDAGLTEFEYEANNNHGLGVQWIDYDNDQWPDLFITNGMDFTAHLYHNEGDGTFSNADDLLPVLPNVEMMGAAFSDYDQDGDSDLYIFVDHEILVFDETNPTSGPANLLLQNQFVENGNTVTPGTPLFNEVAAAAGVDALAPVPFGPSYDGYRSVSGGWLDYNRDGYTDLFVGNWIVEGQATEGTGNLLYLNNGDGTFSNVTVSSGVDDGTDPDVRRPTLAAITGHIDNDLWPDIYEANAAAPDPHHYDRLLKNDGGDGFIDVSATAINDGMETGAAMGVAIGDPNLDGIWDLYLTDLYDNLLEPTLGNTLYIGNGDGTFGLSSAITAGVQSGSSWGANFVDLDQDGDEDLFVATMGLTIEAHLFENNNDGSFTNISTSAGLLSSPGNMRGSALADYDRDGDMDIVVASLGATTDGRLHLFRNDSTDQGHSVQVRLTATESNNSAIGAVIKATAGAMPTMMRQITGGSSAHSQDESVVHFGLGESTLVDTITVEWPSGVVDVVHDVAADQIIDIVEGSSPSADTMLANYTFDGSDASDASDYGHDGVVSGTPLFVTDMFGTTLLNRAPGDLVMVDSGPGLEGDTVALSLWIKLRLAPNSRQMLVTKVDGATGYRLGFVNGNLLFRLQGAGGNRASVSVPTATIPLDQWVAVSATYDGTNVNLWLDGQLVGTAVSPGLAIGTSGPLTIGADASTLHTYRGAVDEVELRGAPLDAQGECERALKVWDAGTSSCLP